VKQIFELSVLEMMHQLIQFIDPLSSVVGDKG
ncbi:hypothetical protein SMU80_05396, partial [Streptococcus mutans SF1]